MCNLVSAKTSLRPQVAVVKAVCREAVCIVHHGLHLDQVLCEVETDYNECLQAINMLQKLANYLKSRVSELHRSEFYHETAPEYHRRAQS